MNNLKTKTDESLFPLLSPFHEISGLTLRSVQQVLLEGSIIEIAFDFGVRSLIIEADPDDDTVILRSAALTVSDAIKEASSHEKCWWKELVGQPFGWGWMTINQQGYLDGVILSFSGIMPTLMITVVASSLKISIIPPYTV